MTQSTLIIGYGFAGRRMHRALDYERSIVPGRYAAPAIVDPRPDLDLPPGSSGFRSLDEALDAGAYDAVFVTVNEAMHYEVLRRIARTGPSRILCEKPLAATLAQAHYLETHLRGLGFRMNMVERYSPVFREFFRWRAGLPDLRVARIQLFWGKNRLRDTRPTIGVLSEIIHPLDIAAFAFDIERFEVLDGFTHHSDFTCEPEETVADTVHCKLRTPDGTVISAHASFAWMERRREVFAHLVAGGRNYLVQFRFDMPLWDCDSLTVWEVDGRTGARRTVLESRFDNGDFPASLHQIGKVHRFVAEALAEPEPGRRAAPETVGLDHAVRLQEWLSQIETQLAGRREPLREALFAPARHEES